ncbi:hypothetical protein AKJ64_01655 [candidate division MSBL1 archaeon SCGC-AAA259E17]|uniref:Nitroreductase domain-containing protein n=1 Tax=candidate division MSBL1 archaeon SCGC-AAA259E17 TaxID=1698263 RepID=A0A133UFK1_9EURY|nr:hypothetical protein AKJ64_01655 [candidate division MSBL1 archaeon SCGC-AAA259E17]
MDVEEAILRRRAVRSFEDREVPKEKLEEIMNSVRMAPSASNKQDWKFVIVMDDEKKEEVYRAANKQSFVKEASAVIAGITTDPEYRMSCGIPSGVVDLSIAMDHLTLKAAEEGLGTCWIGAFDQEKAKDVLEVPDEYEIVALMPIGYPKTSLEKRSKNRAEAREIVSYNTFSE